MSEGPPSSNPFAKATPEVSPAPPKEQEASEPKSDPKIEALLKVWESPVKQKAFVEGIALKSGEQIDAIAHTVYEAAEQLREQGSKTEGQTEEQRNFFWAKFHVLMAIFNFLTTLSFKKTREKDDANKKQILKELQESELSGQELALSRVLRHEEVADVFENPAEYYIKNIPQFCQKCISLGAAHEVVDHFGSIKDQGDRRLVLKHLLDRAEEKQVEIYDWIGGVLEQCEDVDIGVAERLVKAKRGVIYMENHRSAFAFSVSSKWFDLIHGAKEGMSEEEVRAAFIESERKLTARKERKRKEFFDSYQQAREILGAENVIGPDEVGKVFGVTFENTPKIPFSKEDLEKAKELNQFLILRYDELPNGRPITAQELQSRFRIDQGRLVHSEYMERLSSEETPRLGWSLTSKELIPNSTSKNYLQQTDELIAYLKTNIFPEAMPQKYQAGIDTFEKKKSKLEALMSSDWREAAKQLSELEITHLTRRNAVEITYDLSLIQQTTGKRLLAKQWDWTSSRDASGNLVDVGNFNAAGASVDGFTPDNADSALGSVFSRMS